jgi:hypothetical protein
MHIKQGQSYRVNSFDLGFINTLPVDLLVEIKEVDYYEDHLEIDLPLQSDQVRQKGYRAIETWFRQSYPTMRNNDCILKSPSRFERLIVDRTAMLVDPHANANKPKKIDLGQGSSIESDLIQRMTGEKDLATILKTLRPEHNEGDYVFCNVSAVPDLSPADIVMLFKEKEGTTLILKKEMADIHRLPYSFVAAWITLSVHSSLEAVGLTAAFSKALAAKSLSCNVVAACYHDHIFVDKKDLPAAMEALRGLAR